MSTTLKKDQKNGTEKKADAPNAAQQTNVQTAKQQDATKLSIEERIQRVEELRSLTGKRQRTIETLNSLRTFNFGSNSVLNKFFLQIV